MGTVIPHARKHRLSRLKQTLLGLPASHLTSRYDAVDCLKL
jgi:hypothetical protein